MLNLLFTMLIGMLMTKELKIKLNKKDYYYESKITKE